MAEQPGSEKGWSKARITIALALVVALGGLAYFLATPTFTEKAPAKPVLTINIPVGASIAPPFYDPQVLVVEIGVNNTVRWVNKDAVPHTVTDKNNSFDSGILNEGDSWTYTFTKPGTYTYYCKLHLNMIATVTVMA